MGKLRAVTISWSKLQIFKFSQNTFQTLLTPKMFILHAQFILSSRTQYHILSNLMFWNF